MTGFIIEPLGLLHGAAAAEAIASGRAQPLLGGAIAFTLARLKPHGPIVPIGEIPSTTLHHLATTPPPWAGLPADRPLVMGVVNVTPDSFSDGGAHFDTERAITAGRAMAAAGADMVDVGGESTRPHAAPVAAEVEQARILPVIRALAQAGVVVSVDTRNAATMAAALDGGARIVNDISALTHDPAAARLVAARHCPVVLMHSRGTPATMHTMTNYGDVAWDVAAELAALVAAAEAAGIARAAIAIDPGIGFAKAAGQNEALLARLPVLLSLGCRLVVGVSRKSFIGRLSGQVVAAERLPGSLAAGMLALQGGASMLRTHDVAATVQAVRVWQGIIAGA